MHKTQMSLELTQVIDEGIQPYMNITAIFRTPKPRLKFTFKNTLSISINGKSTFCAEDKFHSYCSDVQILAVLVSDTDINKH